MRGDTFNIFKVKVWLTAIACCSLPASAATWYAAANGSRTNGTYGLPWSPSYAVTNTNPYLQPGDTVIFKSGGAFVCSETNGSYSLKNVLEFRKSGTTANRITYRPETLWGFSFDGGLLLTASNLVVEQFRIFNSRIGGRAITNDYFCPPGISDYAPDNKLLHNLIENVGHPGIASWKPTRGKYIAGNIIRFVGYNDWSTNHVGEARGSGMYLQNTDNSSEAVITGNISYYNYTTAMKAYGNTDIWRFRFHRNINTLNSEAGVFYHLDNYGSDGVTVTNNYLWRNGVGVRIGYPLGNGGHSNAVVANNYVVESGYPFYQVDGWRNCVWTNNVGVRLDNQYIWYLENTDETSGDIASHTIDWNTYYATNYAPFGGGPFMVKDVTDYFPQWQAAISGDGNSTYHTNTLPSGTVVFAFRPSTDTNFVHIAVFNWDANSSVNVDLSSYFPSGTLLAIYDAQNIPTAFTNLVYTGGDVALPLSLTNRATMIGTFSQRSGTWQGFDNRFRAFVVHRRDTAGPVLPPTALRTLN